MTGAEYWATLRTWGITPKARVTPTSSSWICQNRDGEPVSVPDPTGKSADEIEAELELIKRVHVRLDS